MPGSFTEKLIDVQITMANGQFEGGGNQVTLTGHRVSARILNLGSGNGQADFAIYGMPLKTMNQLSNVGRHYLKRYRNSISARAGDTENGMTVVWTGQIIDAFVDAQDMPNVCFRIVSSPGAFEAIKPVPPTTHSGSADAAQMMSALAGQMGFQFENAGVDVKIANPYYPGTAWTQALQIARDGGFTVVYDKGTMVIVPPGKARQGDPFLISRDTGMVGYPAFNQAQVLVTALFNPVVKPQGYVQIESDLTAANGRWIVSRLEYELESFVPGGKWFMNITGYSPDPTVA